MQTAHWASNHEGASEREGTPEVAFVVYAHEGEHSDEACDGGHRGDVEEYPAAAPGSHPTDGNVLSGPKARARLLEPCLKRDATREAEVGSQTC